MICSKCGAMNADGMRFCGYCGGPLTIVQAQQGSVPYGQSQPQQGGVPYGQPQAQQGGVPYGQPQAQQGGVLYGQPQPQSDEGHGICRYHRAFACLRFLWMPLLIVILFEHAIASALFGKITADYTYVGWKYLAIVWSVVSLIIARRAKKLQYPKAGSSVTLSVVGLVSALIMNGLLSIMEWLGAHF